MRPYRRGAVAYPVHEFGAEEVDEQLHAEVYRHKQGYLGKRYAEAALKRQKKQRGEVVDYRLTDISRKTRSERGIVAFQRDSAHIYTSAIR